jgi:hypothetical protein
MAPTGVRPTGRDDHRAGHEGSDGVGPDEVVAQRTASTMSTITKANTMAPTTA